METSADPRTRPRSERVFVIVLGGFLFFSLVRTIGWNIEPTWSYVLLGKRVALWRLAWGGLIGLAAFTWFGLLTWRYTKVRGIRLLHVVVCLSLLLALAHQWALSRQVSRMGPYVNLDWDYNTHRRFVIKAAVDPVMCRPEVRERFSIGVVLEHADWVRGERVIRATMEPRRFPIEPVEEGLGRGISVPLEPIVVEWDEEFDFDVTKTMPLLHTWLENSAGQRITRTRVHDPTRPHY